MKLFPSLLAFAAFGLAAGSQAAQVEVEWQSPQRFTDIGSNDGSQEKFRAALFGALDAVFAEQAARLPDGQTLEVTVTNLDMAGVMRVGPRGGYQRVVQASQFPQITLDYRLRDADGKVIASQSGVNFKYLGFYNASNAVRQADSAQPFYFESEMIRTWYGRTFTPAVAMAQAQ